MTSNTEDATVERLNLQSAISELARIPEWIERLAARYAIPNDMQFAMDLSLEEVISNIMRHGYAGQPNRPIRVQFSSPRASQFVFIVEDEAPHFNPLAAPELPCVDSQGQARIGGHGVRLIRHFAGSLEYQQLPGGNRLTLGFSRSEAIQR
jgi:anti-sigma regulatory factor (Ser/Thr protein kinase)